MISKQLKGLAKKKEVNVQDVQVSQQPHYHLHILAKTNARSVNLYIFSSQEAILMYNQKYKARWSFDALSTFVKVSVSN